MTELLESSSNSRSRARRVEISCSRVDVLVYADELLAAKSHPCRMGEALRNGVLFRIGEQVAITGRGFILSCERSPSFLRICWFHNASSINIHAPRTLEERPDQIAHMRFGVELLQIEK
jgi:hypothetical protein